MKRFILIAYCSLWLGACAHTNVVLGTQPVSDQDRAEAQATFERGVRFLDEGKPVASALAEFERALAQNPDHLEAGFEAAMVENLLGDEERSFRHWLMTLRPNDPRTIVALWEANRFSSSRRQAEEFSSALQRLRQSPDTLPEIRAQATDLYGQALRHQGRFSEAEHVFAELGYVRDWLVVGPFDNDQNAGFDTAYPPEKGLSDLQQSYPGKIHPVRFRRVLHFDFDGRIPLGMLLDPSQWVTAYLVSFVYSNQPRTVALRIAAYRGVKIWLNGRLLLSDDQAELAAIDQYVVPGQLETGWNQLMVKVCQRTGPWQVRLRLTNLDGSASEKVITSTEIHPSPDRSADTTPLPVPTHVADRLTNQHDPHHSLRDILQVLWNMQGGFFKRAAELATELSAAYPHNPLIAMLSGEANFQAGNDGSALRALRAAEQVSPGLPAALLQRATYEEEHHRYERALRILDPLLHATPVLPVVRSTQIALLSKRGFTVDALRLAQEFAVTYPDRSWTWNQIGMLSAELQSQSESQSAYQHALELRADEVSTYDRLSELAERRSDLNTALLFMRRKSTAFPGQLGSTLNEARLLMQRQEYAAALAVCGRLLTISPDYWYIYQLQGDILYRQGNSAAALASYRRALTLRPDNSVLREYLDYLEGRPDPIFEHYAVSETQVEELLGNRPDPMRYPQAEAIFLLDDQVSHVFRDGSAKHLVHQIYLICNEKGQRSLNHFAVPRGPTFRLEVAETIQLDGSRQEATSIRSGEINFPALRPGSLLHVAYRFETAATDWMRDHFVMSFNFQGRHPSLRARWVLVLPADKPLQVLRHGDLVREERAEFNGEAVYLWSTPEVPPIPDEPFSPPLRSLLASVYVSTISSWEVLARWQNSLIADQFEVNEEIRQKTRSLVQGLDSPLEKVRAIYEFVASEIRYLDNDVGIFGKKPNRAINVYENRFGDCKDKATLMIAMLKEVGIQAAYAAVRTRERGPVFWEVPHAQTNHIITYLPVQPGIPEALFVDGTARFGYFRYLPDNDQGIAALVLDGHGYELVPTPELPPDAAMLVAILKIRLAPDDALLMDASERWTGWAATSHRAGLTTTGKRELELGRELASRWPGAKLVRARFSGLDDLGEAAASEYQLHVPGRVRRENDTLRCNPLWQTQMVSKLAREYERHNPLFLGSRWTMTLTAELSVPEHFQAQSVPQPLSLDTDLIGYDYRCTASGGPVRCTRSLQLRTREVPVARYDEWRRLCLQIDQAEAQEIVLVPKRR